MKIYRAHEYDPVEGSLGFKWFLSKRDANNAQKAWNDEYVAEQEIYEYDVAMNKWDIIAFLNAYCSYADNG